MLGHVLRSSEDTPAFLSIKFAIYMSETMVGRQSCQQMNLFQVIKKDLESRYLYLNNMNDFYRLRTLALDRGGWRALFNAPNVPAGT